MSNESTATEDLDIDALCVLTVNINVVQEDQSIVTTRKYLGRPPSSQAWGSVQNTVVDELEQARHYPVYIQPHFIDHIALDLKALNAPPHVAIYPGHSTIELGSRLFLDGSEVDEEYIAATRERAHAEQQRRAIALATLKITIEGTETHNVNDLVRIITTALMKNKNLVPQSMEIKMGPPGAGVTDSLGRLVSRSNTSITILSN